MIIMAGGIIQLAAYGVQDLYLTGAPQITFFKALYRRHTNFAIESVPQYFSSRPIFGDTVSCTVSRIGDLMGQTHLYVELPAIPKFVDAHTGYDDPQKWFRWVEHIGYVLTEETIVEIGGRQIDKQYGEWLYIWSQLTESDQASVNKRIGHIPQLINPGSGKPAYGLYIPLQFWFCRFTGLSLPLVALAASDVRISIKFRALEDCCIWGPTYSIAIMEDISPFQRGDYIEQTLDGQTVRAYVTGFDYIRRRLYYNKLTTSRQQFRSATPDGSMASLDTHLTDISLRPYHLDLQVNTQANRSYRIYGSDSRAYVTPQPNSIEIIEPDYSRLIPGTDGADTVQLVNSYLYVDYVYLDSEERKKFSTTNHEYLIEQLQVISLPGITSPNAKVNLTFRHTIKALYWVGKLTSRTNQWFDYQAEGQNLVTNAKLQMNGKDLFDTQAGAYFNWYQPYVHHTRGPALGINTYAFSLYPEKHQPSATMNMSLVEQASLLLRLHPSVSITNPASITVYAINYNILRVSCNLAGIGFA